MADIQQTITEQMTASDTNKMPRIAICIQNGSGSFTMPTGLRLTLINPSGQVVCTGNDGGNSLDIIGASSVTLQNLQSCFVRLEQCNTLNELDLTDGKFNCAGATITNLNLELVDTNIFNCTVQNAQFNQCDLNSLNNTYQMCSIQNGQTSSNNDTFSGQLSFSDNAMFMGFQPTLTGGISAEQSNLILKVGQGQGAIDLTDCQATLSEGQYQSFSVSGDSSIVTFKSTQLEGSCDLEDGQFSFTDTQIDGSLSFQNAQLAGQTMTCTSSFSFQTGNVVIRDSTFNSSVTITDAATALDDNEFDSTVTINNGSLFSNKSKVSGNFTQMGGNITSFGDQWQQAALTQLIGPSSIRSLQGVQQLDVEGDNSATILLDDCKPQQLTVKQFGTARLAGVMAQQMTAQDVSSLQTDDCTIQTATITDCMQFNSGKSVYNNLTLSQVGLAVTNSVSSMTCTDSTVVDNGSTISSATTCTLILNGSTATTTNCLVNSVGGSVTDTGSTINNNGGSIMGSGSTVTSTGGSVNNSTGISMGQGFSPEDQGAAILYTEDLTVMCTTGDIDVQSTIGNINETAAIDINLTSEG